MDSMGFGRRTGRALAVAGLTAVAWAPAAADAAPAPPVPAHASPAPGAPGAPGKAVTPPHPRGNEERLWLLGGLVTALAAAGLVARAALRDHPAP
ncbi:hypothetical protein ACIPQA_13595 [Streptomyces sp. NPDC090109]|uniref:hypothetical protein n=1 Tax=unclassified Streptomyces TaxID=2593676 RepID=UPI00136C0B18|nr:hypothetical protein [Streptomyces sp. SID5770]MZE54391.1 hypothetical protein [Streptomyces sp. SID5770]